MRGLASILAAWAAIGCVMWPGAAHAEWYEATGRNVRVFAEGKESYARELAERLERFDAALRVIRQRPDLDLGDAAKLRVYVVDDAADVARLSRSRNVAGFYSARPGGSLAIVPRHAGSGGKLDVSAETVLLHEYTHHFMFRNFTAAYPPWLAEGFAEFHSTARFEEDGAVTIGLAAVHRTRELRLAQSVPLARLIDPEQRDLPWESIYGRGWLLTHYLHFAAGRTDQLNAYIRALHAGKPAVEAGKEAFGDLKALDRELDRYMNTRMHAMRLNADAIKVSPVSVRRMTDAESAAMPIHIVSTSGVDRAAAERLLPRARRALHPLPNDAFAQGVLAEAEYDAGSFAEAEAAARRAIAADPRSRQGLIYQSMAMAAQARERKDTSDATMKAICAPLFRANRLDPDDPRPILMIYTSYTDFGLSPPKSARDAIPYAQMLAPEYPALRMLAAVEYMERGQPDNARAMITPIAYSAHGGNQAARQLLAAIANNDKASVRAALPTADAEDEGGD